jgi:hypothetical protein
MSTFFAFSSADSSWDIQVVMKNLTPIFRRTGRIVVLGVNSHVAIPQHEMCTFLSKQQEIGAEKASLQNLPGLSS